MTWLTEWWLTKWLDSQNDFTHKMTWLTEWWLTKWLDVSYTHKMMWLTKPLCLTTQVLLVWLAEMMTHKMTWLTKWLYSQNDLTHKMTRHTKWHTKWLYSQNDLTHKMTWLTKWLDSQNDLTHKMTWLTEWLDTQNDLTHKMTHKMTLLTEWLDTQNDLTHKMTWLTEWLDTQNDLTHKMTHKMTWLTEWLDTQNDLTHKMTWLTKRLHTQNDLTHKMTHKMTWLTKWLDSQNDLTHTITLCHESTLLILCPTHRQSLTHTLSQVVLWVMMSLTQVMLWVKMSDRLTQSSDSLTHSSWLAWVCLGKSHMSDIWVTYEWLVTYESELLTWCLTDSLKSTTKVWLTKSDVTHWHVWHDSFTQVLDLSAFVSQIVWVCQTSSQWLWLKWPTRTVSHLTHWLTHHSSQGLEWMSRVTHVSESRQTLWVRLTQVILCVVMSESQTHSSHSVLYSQKSFCSVLTYIYMYINIYV